MQVIQLRTLLHVAELGSLSKAADRLGIAQPALSRQIRQMESELGSLIFVRHGRGMVLTDLGREILKPAADILLKLDEIRGLAAAGTQFEQGLVRFGMPPTIAEVMTVPLTRALRADHPRLSLRISSAFSGHLLDWLKRDELDCCVCYDPEVPTTMRIVPLLHEQLFLVGSAQQRLSMDRPVSFESLRREPLILPSARQGLRPIIDLCARQRGVELSAVVEADAFGAMIELVRNGFGYTIMSLAPIYRQIKSSVLTAAPLVDPSPSRCLVIAYPVDRPVVSAARYVGQTFAGLTAEFVAQGILAGHILGNHPRRAASLD